MQKITKSLTKLSSVFSPATNNPTKQRIGRVLLVLVICCLITLTIWLFLEEDSRENNAALGSLDGTTAKIGKTAPIFALEDARNESALVKLADYYGKPIILNFYASWCGPCREEIPDFEKASQQLNGQVTFIGINFAEDAIRAVGILDLFNATYTAALDRTGEIGMKYGLQGLPYTVFIDSEGILVTVHPGLATEEILIRNLKRLGINYSPEISD